MKKLAIFLVLFSICCSLFAGCVRRPNPGTPAGTTAPQGTTASPETTTPPVTTLPPETTVPPTTEAAYVPLEVKLDPEVYYIDTRFWYRSQGECPEGYYQLGDEGWEEIASHMTTRALIETALAYPKLLDLDAASQTFVLYLLNRRIGIVEELLSREDLEWALYTYPVDWSKAWNGDEIVDLDLLIQQGWFNRLKAYVYGADYLWDPEAEWKNVDIPW